MYWGPTLRRPCRPIAPIRNRFVTDYGPATLFLPQEWAETHSKESNRARWFQDLSWNQDALTWWCVMPDILRRTGSMNQNSTYSASLRQSHSKRRVAVHRELCPWRGPNVNEINQRKISGMASLSTRWRQIWKMYCIPEGRQLEPLYWYMYWGPTLRGDVRKKFLRPFYKMCVSTKKWDPNTFFTHGMIF